MKFRQISINVKTTPRGNYHGYTASDYARAAAAAIEKSLCDSGHSSWPDGDSLAEMTAVSRAEEQISKCREGFRDLLSISVEPIEIEE